jgi:hypothetical protein
LHLGGTSENALRNPTADENEPDCRSYYDAAGMLRQLGTISGIKSED